jgi:hypothetical protein
LERDVTMVMYEFTEHRRALPGAIVAANARA